MHKEDQVIRKLISLGDAYAQIRAMILFSSRTNPNASCDVFSDYDISIFAQNPEFFGGCDDWFEDFGTVLVTYREEPSERYNGYTRLIQYTDGTKIDFGVSHIDELSKICSAESLPAHYDLGYIVLLDKDGITASLKKPTYKAFIPKAPTETDYSSAVSEFWFNSTYVSKFLWRNDLMAAKYMLERWLNQSDLRTMLEWSVEIDRNWSWKPGAYGRGLTKELDPATCKELVETYAGGDIEELWESLFRIASLFRKIAVRVADALGYKYLYDLDKRVSIYHRTVRNLDRQTTDPHEFADALTKALASDSRSSQNG